MTEPSSKLTFGNSIWGRPYVQLVPEPPVLQVEPLSKRSILSIRSRRHHLSTSLRRTVQTELRRGRNLQI